MSEVRVYEGSCHCGAVRWTAESDMAGLADCNCSRCHRLGWVMQAVPGARFTLLQGADKLQTYRFNTHTIEHLFCADCGIESFGRGTNPAGESTVMINVNCIDGFAYERAAVTHYDGRSW